MVANTIEECKKCVNKTVTILTLNGQKNGFCTRCGSWQIKLYPRTNLEGKVIQNIEIHELSKKNERRNVGPTGILARTLDHMSGRLNDIPQKMIIEYYNYMVNEGITFDVSRWEDVWQAIKSESES